MLIVIVTVFVIVIVFVFVTVIVFAFVSVFVIVIFNLSFVPNFAICHLSVSSSSAAIPLFIAAHHLIEEISNIVVLFRRPFLLRLSFCLLPSVIKQLPSILFHKIRTPCKQILDKIIKNKVSTPCIIL